MPLVPPQTFAEAMQLQAAPTSEDRDKLTAAGRNAWQFIHGLRILTEELLLEFVSMIPIYGCGCSEFYHQWADRNPPPIGEDPFEWSWRLHNAVNAKLERAAVSLDEAMAIWRPTSEV